MACKDVAQEVLWWVSLDSSVHALSMNWWQKPPPGCSTVVAQPQLGTYSGSDGCRNTCCWWDREEENGKYPMCLQRKRTQRVLWSQTFVGFSLFGLFMLLGGFLEELQNSALTKATFRLPGNIPSWAECMWGELWPWGRHCCFSDWLLGLVPKVKYQKQGQPDEVFPLPSGICCDVKLEWFLEGIKTQIILTRTEREQPVTRKWEICYGANGSVGMRPSGFYY